MLHHYGLYKIKYSNIQIEAGIQTRHFEIFEICILGTYLAKFLYFGLCFAMFNDIAYFSALFYDIIGTSYIGCLYLFWYAWKEESHSYTMVPIRHIWDSFSSSPWLVNTAW